MSQVMIPTTPTLAKPGAGLPKPELVIARLRFKAFRKRSSRADLSALVESEQAAILKLVRSVDADTAARQVLIRRLRGMEDSSRFWSLLMVIHHLQIVNDAVAHSIALLGRGEVPSGAVSTADVKPDPDIDAKVLEKFKQSCASLQEKTSAITDLNTSAKHAHPWFGPLDASGWFAMAAFHMRLHRKQMERILAAL